MHAWIMVILATLSGNFFLFPGIFKDIEIIDDDTVIEIQRSDLMAEHIGVTNAKTKKY